MGNDNNNKTKSSKPVPTNQTTGTVIIEPLWDTGIHPVLSGIHGSLCLAGTDYRYPEAMLEPHSALELLGLCTMMHDLDRKHLHRRKGGYRYVQSYDCLPKSAIR